MSGGYSLGRNKKYQSVTFLDPLFFNHRPFHIFHRPSHNEVRHLHLCHCTNAIVWRYHLGTNLFSNLGGWNVTELRNATKQLQLWVGLGSFSQLFFFPQVVMLVREVSPQMLPKNRVRNILVYNLARILHAPFLFKSFMGLIFVAFFFKKGISSPLGNEEPDRNYRNDPAIFLGWTWSQTPFWLMRGWLRELYRRIRVADSRPNRISCEKQPLTLSIWDHVRLKKLTLKNVFLRKAVRSLRHESSFETSNKLQQFSADIILTVILFKSPRIWIINL